MRVTLFFVIHAMKIFSLKNCVLTHRLFPIQPVRSQSLVDSIESRFIYRQSVAVMPGIGILDGKALALPSAGALLFSPFPLLKSLIPPRHTSDVLMCWEALFAIPPQVGFLTMGTFANTVLCSRDPVSRMVPGLLRLRRVGLILYSRRVMHYAGEASEATFFVRTRLQGAGRNVSS